jgi:hypothetical protein
VLTASGDWIPQPAGTTFRWLRDGDPISGATESTYRVTAEDAGHALRVEITATREGFEPGEARSAALAVPEEPVEPTVTNTAMPVISGTPVVGQTLTVSAGTWSPADVALSYAWYAGANPIPDATGTSLLLTDAQLGAVITVRVTASVGDVSQTVTTAGTPAVRAAGGGGGGGGPTTGPDSAACTAATQALSTAQGVLADVSQRLKSAKAKLKKAKKARKTAQVTKLKKKVAKLKKGRTAAQATVTTALGPVGSAC